MEGRSKTSISDMDALKLNDVWDKKWVIAAKENEKKKKGGTEYAANDPR